MKFQGNFASGEKSGFGIYRYPNGGRYEGKIKNGGKSNFQETGIMENAREKAKSFGLQETPMKAYNSNAHGHNLLIGEYASGTMNGTGVYKFSNGCVYEGEFKNGNMEGKGKYTYNSGGYYDGYWISGKKWGKVNFGGKVCVIKSRELKCGLREIDLKEFMRMVCLVALGHIIMPMVTVTKVILAGK